MHFDLVHMQLLNAQIPYNPQSTISQCCSWKGSFGLLTLYHKKIMFYSRSFNKRNWTHITSLCLLVMDSKKSTQGCPYLHEIYVGHIRLVSEILSQTQELLQETLFPARSALLLCTHPKYSLALGEWFRAGVEEKQGSWATCYLAIQCVIAPLGTDWPWCYSENDHFSRIDPTSSLQETKNKFIGELYVSLAIMRCW